MINDNNGFVWSRLLYLKNPIVNHQFCNFGNNPDLGMFSYLKDTVPKTVDGLESCGHLIHFLFAGSENVYFPRLPESTLSRFLHRGRKSISAAWPLRPLIRRLHSWAWIETATVAAVGSCIPGIEVRDSSLDPPMFGQTQDFVFLASNWNFIWNPLVIDGLCMFFFIPLGASAVSCRPSLIICQNHLVAQRSVVRGGTDVTKTKIWGIHRQHLGISNGINPTRWYDIYICNMYVCNVM